MESEAYDVSVSVQALEYQKTNFLSGIQDFKSQILANFAEGKMKVWPEAVYSLRRLNLHHFFQIAQQKPTDHIYLTLVIEDVFVICILTSHRASLHGLCGSVSHTCTHTAFWSGLGFSNGERNEGVVDHETNLLSCTHAAIEEQGRKDKWSRA